MKGGKYASLEDRDNVEEPERKYTRPLVLAGSIAGIVILTVSIVALVSQIEGESRMPADPLERARRLMEMTPLLDSHNDLPWQYRIRVNNDMAGLDISKNLTSTGLQTDIPRIRQGKLGAQIWSVYVSCDTNTIPDPVQATMEQIDDVYQIVAGYPDVFQLVVRSDDIVPVFQSKKIPSLIGMEGGHSINSSMGALRTFYAAGARYMTLTHICSTPWAQSANDLNGTVLGLTAYGRQIVLEMNRIGMMVDISHVADETMHDTLTTTKAPVIFSHSNARALCNNLRNVPDEVLERIPQNGGVVMVVFYPSFVCETFRVELARLQNTPGCDSQCVNAGIELFQNSPEACNVSGVVAHIDYIKNKIGVDHVGIGSDYDGVDWLPVGMQDVSTYPFLFAELVKLGYTDSDINKILSGNIIRVLREVENVARDMQSLVPVGPAHF